MPLHLTFFLASLATAARSTSRGCSDAAETPLNLPSGHHAASTFINHYTDIPLSLSFYRKLTSDKPTFLWILMFKGPFLSSKQLRKMSKCVSFCDMLSPLTLFMTAHEIRGNSRRVTLLILGATTVAISSHVSSGVFVREQDKTVKTVPQDVSLSLDMSKVPN